MKYQNEEQDIFFEKISIKEQNYNFRFAMILLTIILAFLIEDECNGVVIECPHCQKRSEVDARLFPSVWTCPNEYCGYENYDGIEYCALCGTKRDRRRR